MEIILNIILILIGASIVFLSYILGVKKGFDLALDEYMVDNEFEDGYEAGFKDGTAHEQIKFNELLDAIEEASTVVATPEKKAKKKTTKKSK